MKRTILAGVLAVGAMSFTACGSAPTAMPHTTITSGDKPPIIAGTTVPDPPHARTTTIVPAVSQEETNRELFLIVVKPRLLQTYTDDNLVNAAKAICTRARYGDSGVVIGIDMLRIGWIAKDAGTVMGAGTTAFCPEYTDKLLAEVKAVG